MLTGALRQLFALSRGVPRPQGEPELPEAAGGADLDRGPHLVRAAVLQRQRAEVRHQDPDVPDEPHRRACSTSTAREFFEAEQGVDRGAEGPVLIRPLRLDAVPRSSVYEQISANKRKTVLLDLLVRAVAVAVGAAFNFFLQGGVDRLRDRRGDRDRVVVSSRTSTATRSRCAMAHAVAGRSGAVRPLPQPRRGSVHRERAPEAAAVHRRRPRAERVLDRPQPEARGGRGDDRAAREDEPGRARRRARARAEPHPQLRHARDDARGHDGRASSRCCPTSSCGSCSGPAGVATRRRQQQPARHRVRDPRVHAC